MTKNQGHIMKQLNDIMKPKKEHIDKLTKMVEEDPKREVARNFLAYYQEEYSHYMELKMSLIEEFCKGDNENDI